MPITKSEREDIIAEIGERKISTLTEAIKETGVNRVGVLARESAITGRIQGRLTRQKKRVVCAARETGAWLKLIQQYCESGRMSMARPKFQHTLKRCVRFEVILCVEDSTRLLRAEAGNDFEPKLRELLAFWRLVDSTGYSLPIATIHDPTLSVSELHGLRTKAGMQASNKKPGRQSVKIPKTVFLRILELRGDAEEGLWGEGRIRAQLQSESIKISRRQITKVLDHVISDSDRDQIRIRDYLMIDRHVYKRLDEQCRSGKPPWLD